MSKESLAQINELQPIALRLREREQQIEAGKRDLFSRIGDLTELAYEQGRDIILAKAKTSKGLKFSEWLRIHVPNLPLPQAAKYERVATEQLTDPRQCIFAFIPASDTDKESLTRAKPAAWEVGWGWAHRLNSLFKSKPIQDWPSEQVEYFRAEVEPIAKSLWPDRFAGPSQPLH